MINCLKSYINLIKLINIVWITLSQTALYSQLHKLTNVTSFQKLHGQSLCALYSEELFALQHFKLNIKQSFSTWDCQGH